MKITTILISVFLSALCCLHSKAQARAYYGPGSSQDVEIVYQYDTINLLGKKTAFLYYEFSRQSRIRILNENGVKAYSSMRLPVNYDPSYIIQAPEARNYGNYFSLMKVKQFEIRIYDGQTLIKADKLVPYENNIQSVRTDNKFGSFQVYDYDIQGLKTGYEIELTFRYSVPFFDNLVSLLSFRLFPHSYYKIDDYRLCVAHNKELVVDFNYINGFTPDTTYYADGNRIICWHEKNLPGCMGEDGGRPYKTLPYLIFSVKPSEISYELPNSFESKALPGYFIPVVFREENFQSITLNMGNNVMLRDYPLLHAFVDKNLEEKDKDSLGYKSLHKLHTIIVDRFTFDNNLAFFSDPGNSEPHLGASVGGERLQDICRYDFYVSWLAKTKLFFYSGYITDIRSGEISNDYYAPMFKSDFLFAVELKNRQVVFVYPKKADFGYYTDEIPFYYEGALVRLVCIEDYMDYRLVINEDFRNIHTPASSWSDNSRKSSIQVAVDDAGHSLAKALVILTGQFSTSTRGIYTHNYSDISVNPAYAHKIWDLPYPVKLLSSDAQVQQTRFPFKTTVRAEYEPSDLVSVDKDSVYTIHFSGLFPHIISDGLNQSHRVLDYYPDFKGQDMFTYFFTFSRPVEIIGNIEKLEISNSLGSLQIESIKASDNAIKVTSVVNVSSVKVDSKNINDVAAIFEAVRKLNQSEIKVKLLSE